MYGGVEAWYVQREHPYPSSYEDLTQIEDKERVQLIKARIEALVRSMGLSAVVTTGIDEDLAKRECAATLSTRSHEDKDVELRIDYSAQETEDGYIYVEVSW